MFTFSIANLILEQAQQLKPQGNHLFQKEKLEDALSEYEDAISLDIGSKETYFNAGICYYHLKRYDLETMYLITAIADDRLYVKAYHSRKSFTRFPTAIIFISVVSSYSFISSTLF